MGLKAALSQLVKDRVLRFFNVNRYLQKKNHSHSISSASDSAHHLIPQPLDMTHVYSPTLHLSPPAQLHFNDTRARRHRHTSPRPRNDSPFKSMGYSLGCSSFFYFYLSSVYGSWSSFLGYFFYWIPPETR